MLDFYWGDDMRKEEIEMTKDCQYCEYASPINITGNMLCSKKGIVSCDYKCSSFSYDPLKRIPAVIEAPTLEYVSLEDEEPSDATSAEDANPED